jgi:hypothetical protein
LDVAQTFDARAVPPQTFGAGVSYFSSRSATGSTDFMQTLFKIDAFFLSRPLALPH